MKHSIDRFMPTVDNIVYEDVLALNCVNNENLENILVIDHSLEDLIQCYVLLSLKHYCLWARGAPQQLAISMAPHGAILLVRFELIVSRFLI